MKILRPLSTITAVFAFALVALGSLGDPEEIPLLVRMAFDMNYMIRSDPIDEAITIL